MNKEKLCEFCGEPFVPKSNFQRYCKRPHYMNCPVCGKQYLVTNNENLKRPPVACSYACRVKRTQATSLKKYGMLAPGNNPEARQKAKETSLRNNGVEYAMQSEEVREKAKATLLEKYGVENAMKNKNIQKKAFHTNIEKYGSKTYLTSEQGKQEYTEKMIARYGVLHPIQNDAIKDKIVNTMRSKYGESWFPASDKGKETIQASVKERYGVDYVLQSPEIQSRIKETFLNNYGVDNPSKNINIIKKIQKTLKTRYKDGIINDPVIREKINKTTMERYGVPFYILLPKVRISSGSISKLNLRFAEKLESRNIEFEMEKKISNSTWFDFYIPSANMTVDINPSYTHNIAGNHWSKKGLDLDYHSARCKEVRELGLNPYCLFDWDNEYELLERLSNYSNIKQLDAHNTRCYCIDRKASIEFLSLYGLSRIKHYPRKMVVYGLVYNSEIISAIAIAKNNSVAADRDFCIIDYGVKWGYYIDGWMLEIFKAIDNIINLEDIVIRIEQDRLIDSDIKDLRFESIIETQPTLYWSKKRIRIPIGKYSASQHAMLADGWLPVADCGTVELKLNSLKEQLN